MTALYPGYLERSGMRDQDTQLVNFDMPRATARRLLVVANEQGRSRAAVLRELIDTYLNEDVEHNE